MFVKKEFRGKERGIAAALMNTLLDWAEHRKVKAIYLGTVDVYHAAHRSTKRTASWKWPAMKCRIPSRSWTWT